MTQPEAPQGDAPNAEDCPRCDLNTLAYPYVCPGHTGTPAPVPAVVNEKLLRSSLNAQDWAREFMKLAATGITIDEGLMIGWFANAIEFARDAGRAAAREDLAAELARVTAERDQARAELERLRAEIKPTCSHGEGTWQYGHVTSKVGWVWEPRGINYASDQRMVWVGEPEPIKWEDRELR